MASKKAPKKTKAETPEKKDEVKVDTFSRDLICALSREEVEERAAKAAELIEKRDLKQSDFDSQRKYWKNQIEEIEVEIRSVSSEVRSRKTSRQVVCERIYDYANAKVRELRTDTGEVLSERAMTDAERQKELDFGDNDVDEAFGDAAE